MNPPNESGIVKRSCSPTEAVSAPAPSSSARMPGSAKRRVSQVSSMTGSVMASAPHACPVSPVRIIAGASVSASATRASVARLAAPLRFSISSRAR